ncbi:MAG: outer membrane beta-barrel protein [Bacteroidales bacterium]|mgnify:CR=1 FL=1|nr:outer membrane beta-barrel protein [Bacteroidales bacterium]MBR6062906.1 outer membrane beta-barrel protein [Bacteroidales bacterium]
MKKIFIIFLMFSCSITMLMAQGQGTFRAGLRIGPNFSTLYGIESDGQKIPTLFSYSERYKMKPGVRAGFVFDIGLTDVISIQPAIYYSLQRWGSKGQFELTDSIVLKTDETLSMQLIQIPVLVNFRIAFKNDFRKAFVFGVGPYFSVAMVGQDVLDGLFINQYTGESLDIRGKANFYKNEEICYYVTQKNGQVEKYKTDFDSHPFHRCDFGFTVAAGFELNRFYIGVAADFGVINSANTKEWEEAGVRGYSQRNLNLQATVGYYF